MPIPISRVPFRSLAALLWVALVAWVACDINQNDAGTVAPVELFAFPDTVPPGTESALVVEVHGACGDGSSCTLCVGISPNGAAGSLYTPGETPGSLTALGLAGVRAEQPMHLTYRAASATGVEVVTASLFDVPTPCMPLLAATPAIDAMSPQDGAVGASTADLTHLVGSASVRITIANPAAGSSNGDAGDAGVDAPDNSEVGAAPVDATGGGSTDGMSIADANPTEAGGP